MDDDVRAFGTELGRKALEQEWAGVHAMLAPWLRKTWSVEKVQGFFEDEYRATLEANGAEGSHHPEYPEPQLGFDSFCEVWMAVVETAEGLGSDTGARGRTD